MSEFHQQWSTSLVDIAEMMAYVQGAEEEEPPPSPNSSNQRDFNLVEIALNDHRDVVPNFTLLGGGCGGLDEDDTNLMTMLPSTPSEIEDFNKLLTTKQSDHNDTQPGGHAFYQPPPAGNYSETDMRFLLASPMPSNGNPDTDFFSTASSLSGDHPFTQYSPQDSAIMDDTTQSSIATESDQGPSPFLLTATTTPTGRRRGRKPKALPVGGSATSTIPKKKKKYELFDPLNPSQNDKDVKNAAQAKRNREKQKEQMSSMKERIIVLEDDNGKLKVRVASLEDDKKKLEVQLSISDMENKRLELEGSHWKGKFVEELTQLRTVFTTNAQYVDNVLAIVEGACSTHTNGDSSH